MKILMIAGEPSGDAHGAELIQELKKIYPQLTVYGIGGPRMVQEGLQARYTLEALSVHGLIELLPHLPRLYRILWELRDSLDTEQPDMAIFVDYPGFNLKLAAYVKQRKIPVVWFSSPQVWAWRKGRIHKIVKVVDKMLVLFPFEEKIYQEVGVNVSFVGHPRAGENRTLEQIQTFKAKHSFDPNKPIITLAVGSRSSEIKRHLPVVLEALTLLRQQSLEATYLLPIAKNLDKPLIQALLAQCPIPIHPLEEAFLDCIYASDAAIVSSGTATLQTGLAGTPFVIIYSVAPLTYKIAKRLAQIPYFGMVNILSERFVVKELIQDDMTPQNITLEILRLFNDAHYREQMVQDLKKTRTLIGEPGAYQRSAESIDTFFQTQK